MFYLKKTIFVTFFLFFIVVFLNIPKANAIVSGDLTYHLSFDTLYQGDNAHINITLTSTSTDDINIKWIRLRFNWMGETEYIEKDYSSNHIGVSKSGGTADFGQFDFQIPSDVVVGNHVLTVRIGFDEHHVGLSWDYWTYDDEWNEEYTVSIHSIKEKQYKELQPTVFQELTNATKKSFLSSGAKDVLQQATSKYNVTTSLASQGKWSEAYEALQLTQSLLKRAIDEENNFIILVARGGGIGITLAIGVIIYVIKNRR